MFQKKKKKKIHMKDACYFDNEIFMFAVIEKDFISPQL